MYHPNQINRKLILFFIVAGMVLLSIMLLIGIISFTAEKKPEPTPSPIHLAPTAVTIDPDIVNPLQKAAIGSQLTTELESRPDFLGKQTLSTGETEYSFVSEIDVRPAIILTDKNGEVIFERIMIPSEPESTGYSLISEYKTRYGQPEADIAGSHFYEWAIHTYVYASQGFALIGNPNTDEVFEIHSFQPMSVEEYRVKFGQDIDVNAQPPIEPGDGTTD